jgi:adhesin transport system outer membrane protein
MASRQRFGYSAGVSCTNKKQLPTLVDIAARACSGGGLLFLLSTSAAHADTLVEAVARAMQYFPEMRVAASQLAAAEAQVGQARAEFLPAVNVSAGEGRETSKNPSTRFLPGDPTLTRQERDVTISQLVFDGGVAGGQLNRFRARVESAAYTVSSSAENIASRAAQTYTEVVRLREQLAVAADNVATHQKTLSDVTLLADAGRGRRADVVQAEARLALAASTIQQLSGQLQQAEATYRYYVGRPPGELVPPPPLEDGLPVQLAPALEAALAAHPAVLAAEKGFEAAQYDRDTVRARRNAPRVSIEAGASRNRDIDGVAGPNADRYAMLRMRYNLFRGFGDDERLRDAEARVNEALSDLTRVRNEVARDIRQAWETLLADRMRLPQLERYAVASADVAEAYRLQFQLGQRSLLDVLNAENERYGARGSLIAGRTAVAAGEIRVLASLGRLLPTLGVAVPGYRDAEVQR